jgi:hypothetical protein
MALAQSRRICTVTLSQTAHFANSPAKRGKLPTAFLTKEAELGKDMGCGYRKVDPSVM